MRELSQRPLPDDPDRTQLHLLEERLGASRMKDLIAARGTLVELLGILQYSTDAFAADLLRSFDADEMAALVERVDAEKSIGTLNLALRELSQRPLPDDPDRTQLHLLEERLGASRMKDLIAARGTLVELLGILQYSTDAFAADLLRSFDADEMAEIAKRVDAEKSIGTLNLALRELSQRPLPDDPDRTQLHLLEERLGASRMKDLIAARGTLVELRGILQYSTDAFAADLLRSFDADEMAALVERVDAEKSIGTLHLALRELSQRPLPDDPDRTQLHLFEERLGASRMKDLIAARGTLVELLGILQYSTDAFAADLLRSFDADEMAALVERVDAEKSIGTLHLALRELSQRPLPDDPDRTQLHLFEERLGADGFWRLMQGAGNLNHLSYLLDALSSAFRSTVLAPEHAPGPEGWIALAGRGSFYDPARFARDSLAFLPHETADRFREAVEVTAANLAAKSTWGAIGSGLAKMEKVADERVQAALVEAAEQRIETVDIAHLRFENYEEATGALPVFWRREELQPEIGASLWQLLPNEHRWPRTRELLIQGRFILTVARSKHASEADAVRVLKAFALLAPGVAIESKAARYHALLLWNLFALWFARGRGVAEEFRTLQHDRTWQRFVGVVEKRRTWRRDEDKLDTLMLAGALAFLVPDLQARLSALIRGEVRGIQHLAGMADERLRSDTMGFISGFLVFRGMVLSAPDNAIFNPDRIGSLLDKANDYEDRGPAIDYVCRWLRSRRESTDIAAKGQMRRAFSHRSRWRR